ncbi:MAG: hypothetical protein GWN01_00190, partial [Nitrosopumilaceae archaeon]|nr:hypothetical protein [Nitrosopumilaceae archaeon]NIU85774.1 hypothetical protein [Nitrosopumilaceae archaeon]NIX60008.1 hypothetical protein [Nitrosopumilaceae archaeon]
MNRPIKPEIKRLLDDGGIYILVLFAELTKKLRTKRKKALKEEFSRLGYSNEFRIYSANQLANFSESFPALVAWFRGYGSECLPYSSWSEYQEIIRPKKFIFDEDRKKWMEEIQQKLRNANDDYVIYRITGLSGIGKTRFVYETLSANDLKHRVIYVKAEHFRLSNIYTSLQNDPNISTILVIDECDLNQHDEFVRSFSGKGSRVCLFTLSYERGKVPPPSMSYHLEPLSVEKISEIVKTEKPDLPDNLVDRISKFADGYPRIATLLIDSYPLGDASSEEFWNISDDALMNRLIGGKQEIYLPDFKLTKKVLQRLSLFQKVGYYGNLEKEAKWIAEMIKVDYSNFKEIVEQQRRRGIIQGTYYIYVTPFVLRIHLFREWWLYQRFTKESFIEFITSIPEDFRSDLFERFLEHIPYIADVESGKEFIESILGEEGVFLDGSLLKNRLGASFFLKLTEADPKAALDCLNRTVARWTKEELINFTTGRREVIWALERMVMWKNLFNDAARLLLALGEAENETWSNNASGVFVQLFSPAYGRVAPTEASPQERFPILKEAMESKSKERRLIALRACDQALESQHFSRMIGAEFQGLRKEPKLWMPKTYGELFDSYRQVWEFLLSKLGMLPEDERDQGVEILLKRSRGIGRIANLTNMVIDTVYELIKKSYLDKKKALIQVSRILHYDAKEMIPELRQKWVKLKNDLTGVDYASLMRRYVGIILLEDHFDEEGKYKENLNQKYIQELANKSVENPQLIEAELKWLVTNEAQNGHKFGYELGLKDKNYTLLNSLIKAQENVEKYQSFNFLGGYFKAMNEKNPDEREKQFEIFAKDRKKSRWI